MVFFLIQSSNEKIQGVLPWSRNQSIAENNGARNKKRRRRNRQLAILAISAVLLILIIVLVVKAVGAIGNAVNQDETAPVAAESQQETSGEILEVTFKATGDNLIHNTIYQQAAARSSDGGYDFSLLL